MRDIYLVSVDLWDIVVTEKSLRFPVAKNIPDNKVYGANMGPIWGRQDSGGPHVGPMNFAIWD